MADIYWPTHKAKAREAKSATLRQKKRARRLRRLYSNGKRGELHYV